MVAFVRNAVVAAGAVLCQVNPTQVVAAEPVLLEALVESYSRSDKDKYGIFNFGL
jgi:hypothetical protein